MQNSRKKAKGLERLPRCLKCGKELTYRKMTGFGGDNYLNCDTPSCFTQRFGNGKAKVGFGV